MNFNSIKLSTWMRNQKLHLTVTMLTKIPCEIECEKTDKLKFSYEIPGYTYSQEICEIENN